MRSGPSAEPAGKTDAVLTPGAPPPPTRGEDGFAPITLREFRGFSRPFLFSASDGIHGYELFAYDGINAPAMVADIRTTGDAERGGSSPSGMTAIGDRVYFSADDGRMGRELHFYDTVSGRHGLAAEIDRVDDEGSGPEGLFSWGDVLYFSADDKVIGRELWSYDPASATAKSHDLRPGGDSNPSSFSQCGGSLFFLADSPGGPDRRVLWALDGRGGLPTTVPAARNLNISEISREAPGGRLVMGADDGAGTGMEPWSYDCVNRRAVPLGDLNPSGGSDPSRFAIVRGKAFFRADDGAHGAEIWSLSMDDPARARGMIELNPWGDTNPSDLTPFAGRLFFSGYDVNFRLLCSAEPIPGAAVSCFVDIHDPVGLAVHEGVLLFSAFVPCLGECSESLGRELWRYDGIRTPHMVEDIWPGPGSGM